MATLLRLAVAASVLSALCACGGGGSSGGSFNPNPGNGYYGNNVPPCNIGASVTISNPQAGAYGVPSSIGSIEIVTNGNSNAVSANPGAWTLALATGYGTPVPVNGTLNVASDPNGYHPYPSDFYYNESIPQLQPGQQYTVFVEPNGYAQNGYGSCATAIGNFST